LRTSSIKSYTLIFRATILAAFVLIFGNMAWGQTTSKTFDADGTFVVPPGVTSITVEAWGAGGGTRNDGTARTGGGGGGAYARSVLTVTPGQSFAVTVGTGGAPASGTGQSGENSSFGTNVIAAGGAGGTNSGGTGGTTGASVGTTKYAGGNGANRGNPVGGGGGGSAFTNAGGSNGSGTTGGTGTGNGGNGGNDGQPGNNGTAPGGGGGGRGNNGGSSGAGADGRVTVTYTTNLISFTSTGFYTIPPGVTQIKVECWGAGGGGSTITSSGARGGGGGGGAYAAGIITVVPGDAYSVTVGTGGIPSTAGGASYFGSNMVVAAGGNGGTNNNSTGGAGGTTAASIGSIEYAGGSGANGGGTNSGGGGGGAGSTGAGGNASNATAGTGTSLYGGAGGTGQSGSSNGQNGIGFGGGGSGAVTNDNTDRTGGNGAGGLVIITIPANVTLASPSQVADGNVYQGTLKYPVYSFETGVATANALLTALSFTTAGTYIASDITRFQLWFSTTNNFGTAAQLGGNITTAQGPGLHTFSGLNQAMNAGTSGYFWITADIVNTATANATLSVNAIVPSNLTFELTPFYTGSTTAGGIQAILPVPRVAIADAAPQVAAANVNQGTVGQQLFRFTTSVTTAGATLNTLTFTTAGTYAATDIINLKLWYNTSNDFSTALQVGSPIIGSLGQGSHTFSGLNLTTSNGVTGYFWITTDIAPFPTNNNTIRVNAIATGDLSYSTIVFPSGTTSNGGYQTIKTGSGVLLASNYPAVSANSLLQGSTGQRVFKFTTIAISAVTMTGMTFTTAGTYTASDIVNFKLLYNSVNSTVGATTLATLNTGLGAGSHTFPAFSQGTAASTTGYFWITADIATGAGAGHTLLVNAITTANLTYSGTPNKNGSTYAGGIQTIQTKVDLDADGVGDIYDLDDDNDGIPDYNENLPCNNSVAELFPNSNFDAGNTGFYSGYGYVTIVNQNSLHPEGIYAITPNANLGHESFQNCTGHGNMMVVNGSSNPNLIVWSSGTIAVTPNTDYTLTINLTSVNPVNPAQLIFNVNGENIGLQFNATTTNCVWVPGIAIWNSGSNTSATFDILNLNLAPGGNDFAIDDISCKYKIDCDSDGDGVPDRMDLDSDNDGIYDVVEAGGTATANGTISGYADLDLDGLSDNVDDRSSGSGGTDIFNGTPLTNPDTDADTYPNIIDRESDGDGCYDVKEAGFTDNDNDGILGTSPVTVNSAGVVTSASGYTAPADANSDGTRDYVQKIPLITVQPVDRSICSTPATGTTFAVTATNPGGTYQWQVSINNGSSWANLSNGGVYSGTTTATLTISSAVDPTYDRYMYRLLVSNNAYKCSPLLSDAVTLRVSGSVPVISGTISGDAVVCPNATGLAYSISTVSSAISYTWTVPAGWTILSGQNTNAITVSSGIAGGNVSVTASNACGTGPSVSLATSINTPVPTFTAPVSGTACQSANVTYTTQTGKTNYIWTIGGTAGVDYTVTSGGSSTENNLVVKWLTTGSKTVTVNYTSGGCQGITPASSTITVNANAIILTQPANPLAICATAGTVTMGITASGSITSYKWQISTNGGTVWSDLSDVAPYSNTSTNTLTITNPPAGLNNMLYHCVVAGSCGAVTSNSAMLTVNSAPDVPAAILGTITQCPGLTLQSYSITAVPTATTYTWTVPTGWTITGGAGTTSITVTTGSAGQNGNITVTAGNGCGTSAASSLAVTVSAGTPATPGAITGTVIQCPGLTLQGYSVTAVPNASTYTWAVPTGWTITGGAGTNSITVTTGSAGQNGTISVTAGNSCGTSAARTLNVQVASRPVPALTGTASVCAGAIEIYSSDPSNSGYSWNVTGGTITSGGTSSDATATITWSTIGDQSVSVNYANANGCQATSATQLPVHVYKKPETGPAYYVPNNQ
jgi:hypothetical protein